MESQWSQQKVDLPAGDVKVEGQLNIPEGTQSLVIFVHSSNADRSKSSYVAEILNRKGFATLVFDLLTVQEDQDHTNRLNIGLLSKRLVQATEWLKTGKFTSEMALGFLGTGTGAAAALQASAEIGEAIKAVVSKGGRPDLADRFLAKVKTPTLLIVGRRDENAIELNEQAFAAMTAEKKMIILDGASHLFEEPGKLEDAAIMAVQWFNQHLKGITVKPE